MEESNNFAIIIQTSALNWDGSEDMSMKIVDKKPVLYWVINKVLRHWPKKKILIIAPIRDKDSKIKEVVNEINNSNVSIVWGVNNDVLERILTVTSELPDNYYILRILGIHYFFNPEISQKLLDCAFSKKYDWVKPSDDFEIQLTSEVVKVKAFRELNSYLKLNKIPDDKIIRISPIHYITGVFLRDSGQILKKLPKIPVKAKIKMRNKAKKIYQVDRTEINQSQSISVGSQLVFHYEIAKEYLTKNSVVLDVACGDGFGSKMLADKSLIVIGVDIDNQIIQRAQSINSSRNIIYLKADATKLPFPSKIFDTVVTTETLEHVNAKLFLKEIKRVLKSNGMVIISTPQNIDGKIPLNPFHNQEYSLTQLKNLVSKMFDTIEIIGIKTGRLIVKNDLIGTNTFIVAQKVHE